MFFLAVPLLAMSLASRQNPSNSPILPLFNAVATQNGTSFVITLHLSGGWQVNNPNNSMDRVYVAYRTNGGTNLDPMGNWTRTQYWASPQVGDTQLVISGSLPSAPQNCQLWVSYEGDPIDTPNNVREDSIIAAIANNHTLNPRSGPGVIIPIVMEPRDNAAALASNFIEDGTWRKLISPSTLEHVKRADGIVLQQPQPYSIVLNCMTTASTRQLGQFQCWQNAGPNGGDVPGNGWVNLSAQFQDGPGPNQVNAPNVTPTANSGWYIAGYEQQIQMGVNMYWNLSAVARPIPAT